MRGNRFQVIAILLLIVFWFAITCSCKKEVKENTPPPWYPEVNEQGDSIYGIFENKLPCYDEGCTKIKFAMAIYKNEQTNLPTTYLMARVYVGKDEKGRITNTGNVSISTFNLPDAVHTIYKLTSGAPDEFKHFWKINNNLLFILDNDLQPKVGDASYGYVLNRTR